GRFRACARVPAPGRRLLPHDEGRYAPQLGPQVLDVPVPVRDGVLRHGVHVGRRAALRPRPLRLRVAALLAASGGPPDGRRHHHPPPGAGAEEGLRPDGRAQVGDRVRRLHLLGRPLQQLRGRAGHRHDHPRRRLHSRLPAAAGGGARRPDEAPGPRAARAGAGRGSAQGDERARAPGRREAGRVGKGAAMSVAVELPALGESVGGGTVSRWLVKEGDRVEVDQPLVEVTTDKVDAEIPAPAAGVIEKILAREGETVSVGQRLALIDASDATRPAAAEAAAPAAAKVEAAPRAAAEGPRATPLARRGAEREGIDPASVAASSASGRVTKADVEREAARGAAARAAAAPPPPPARAAVLASERSERPSYLQYQLQPGDRVI